MADLPTNFKDDILDTSVNTRRRYRVYENTDGTIELEDVTEYSQVGDEFGAGQINAINTEVNKKFDKNMIVRDLDTINAITKEGYAPDALALKEVNQSLQWKLVNTVTGKTAITLPENFDEVLISLYLDDDTSFTIHIPKLDLTSANKIYREGRGINAGSNYFLTQVRVCASLTTVVLDSWSDSKNNTNTDNSSKIKVSVYYR